MIRTHFKPDGRPELSQWASHAARLTLLVWILISPAASGQELKWSLAANGGPSPRFGAAMAYDSTRGVTVMFGGYDGTADKADTWEWNGTAWTLRTVVGPSPSPRRLHVMAYDSVRRVTVLFGGYNVVQGEALNSETWEWDGTSSSWNQRAVVGPSPRYVSAMAYDTTRHVAVLFGGYTGTSGSPVNDETWEWSGSAWVQALNVGPSARGYHAMCYDTFHNVPILFGGRTGGFAASNQTWERNGTFWTQRIIGGPLARDSHAMSYDAARRVAVLFGGHTNVLDPNPTLFGDTWEWSGTGWTQRVVGGSSPSPRYFHAMAYDSARGVTVLFGGDTGSGLSGETWEASTPLVYVNHAATGANNGGSWTDAFRELRDALNYATTHPGVHEIWVAAGTHTPTTYTGPASRSVSFNLQNNLAIYGGFAGTETSLAERTSATIAANPTILSGDLNGDDNGDLNKNDNSYHVLVAVGGGPTGGAVVDGFTVTAGRADGSGFDSGGGGLACRDNSAAVLTSCTFIQNQAVAGGACYGIDQGSAKFNACRFMSNETIAPTSGTRGGGGAVYLNTCSAVAFSDCLFEGNADMEGRADVMGGVISADTSGVSFARCAFRRNVSAGGSAVAHALRSAGSGAGTDMRFVLCSLVGNVNLGSTVNGAVYTHTSVGHSLQMDGCEVVGNSGATSGGIIIGDSSISLSLSNCTFVANRATNSAPGLRFGAVHGPASSTVTNSLLWANDFAGVTSEASQYSGFERTGFAWSSVMGLPPNSGGTGSNGVDPLFLRSPSPGLDAVWGTDDDDYGDLRLSPGSPAIDSGDSSAVPFDTFDIDGNNNTTERLPRDLFGFPRFADDPSVPDTGFGSPPVDRGCYESQVNCTSCAGIRDWRSPVGGAFAFPGNWFPSVPGPNHDTIFDLSATYDVIFPTGAQLSAKSANIRRGDVAFDLGNAVWSLTSSSYTALKVGSDLPTLASLTIQGGTLQAFTAHIGDEAGANGAVHISGTGSTLDISDDMSIGFFGKGTVTVEAGASLITTTAGVGDQPGSEGSFVQITGAGSTWDIPFFLSIKSGQVNVSNQATLNAGFGVFLFQNGVLSGNGTINGDVVNFGSLRPGNSPGRLTINGDYEQVGVLPRLGTNSGQLVSEIAGTPASGNFDKLTINGTAKLGGLLQVNLTGHTPTSSELYQLLTATGGVQGRFDVALFPSIGADKFLYATYPEAGTQVNLSVQPLGNDPSLSPQENRTVAGEPTAAALGDLNGDGLPDLAVTISNGDIDPGSVVIFLNLGGAGAAWQGFSEAQVIQLPVGIDPRGIVLAHLDDAPGSNSKLDIAVANAGSDSVSIIRNLGSNVYALGSTTTVGNRPVAICAFNLDGDTKVDLATANHDSDNISLLRGNGAGGISSNILNSDVPPEPDTVEPVDPTTDKPGNPACRNLAIGSRSGSSITLLRNSGSGAFTSLAPISIGAGTSQILSRDLNGDGRADLLTGNTDGSVSVILNTTTGNDPLVLAYQPAVNLPIEAATFPGDGVVSLTAFKADLDTDRDIAIAVKSGGVTHVRFLRNDLFAGNLAFTLRPDLVGTEANPIALVSSYVDDEPLTQDLVIVGSDGDGRPGGPGGRSVANVRPVLTGNLCPADFDADGTVDFFDYDAFVACFEGGPCPAGKTADFDGDGAVDFFDYDGFVVAFEHGC